MRGRSLAHPLPHPLPCAGMCRCKSVDTVIATAEFTLAHVSCPAIRARMKSLARDAADVRILCTLQDHGQLSKSRLAEMVGLSATPCFTRLKKARIIWGYHTDIALASVGGGGQGGGDGLAQDAPKG